MSDYRDDAREFRREANWTLWNFLPLVLVALVVLFLIGLGLNYAGVFGERKIFEGSFQYSEARKTEIATYEAQLAELSSRLSNPDLDSNTRANLEAQKSGIRVMLNTAKARQ